MAQIEPPASQCWRLEGMENVESYSTGQWSGAEGGLLNAARSPGAWPRDRPAPHLLAAAPLIRAKEFERPSIFSTSSLS
jgi:hypothetical protein